MNAKPWFKLLVFSPVSITALALGVRLIALCFSWRGHLGGALLPYGNEVGRVASAIAEGRGFSSPLLHVTTGPTAWFAPAYPYLAAAVFRRWGVYSLESHVILQALNCAFSALLILPLYAAAKRTFGVQVAVLASWLWVFLPTAIRIPITYLWDTTLAALWFALILQVTLTIRGSFRLAAWAAYGALWGAGALINPALVSILPFFAGWLVWEERRRLLLWVRPLAVALAVFVLCLVPWTVRNYRVFNRFIPLRSNFGLELWLGNNPQGAEARKYLLHPWWNPAEAARYKRMGEIAYMQEKQREALAFMRSHPAQTLGFMLRRFAETWFVPSDRPTNFWFGAPVVTKAFLVLNAFMIVFCWLGALLAYKTHGRQMMPYLLVLLVFPILFYITHPSRRYRFPMDPLLVVLGTYGVLWTLQRAVRKFRPGDLLSFSKEADGYIPEQAWAAGQINEREGA